MSASRAFFADLAGFTSARAGTMARQRARWTLRGNKYLRNYGGMRKDALVQVDPDLQIHVLSLIEQIAPSLAAAYEQHIGAVATGAFRAWPVASGLSRSLLALEYTTTGGGTTFVGRVRNRAPYAWFIRYSGHGKYGDVVQRLVFGPGRKAADAIARDAAKAMR